LNRFYPTTQSASVFVVGLITGLKSVSKQRNSSQAHAT
jgi:hypothetical protein